MARLVQADRTDIVPQIIIKLKHPCMHKTTTPLSSTPVSQEQESAGYNGHGLTQTGQHLKNIIQEVCDFFFLICLQITQHGLFLFCEYI